VLGYVKKLKKDILSIELKHPISVDRSVKIAIMRSMGHRWRLTGYGQLS
jgi:translation initiation factor 2 gamma subunit (eIF-2gamma)